MMTLCIFLPFELLYSRLCTVLSGVPYVEHYYDVLFVHVLLSLSTVPVFRPRTVIIMTFLSEELVYKLLHCRSVGAAFLISVDIVIFIRCWTMI